MILKIIWLADNLNLTILQILQSEFLNYWRTLEKQQV